MLKLTTQDGKAIYVAASRALAVVDEGDMTLIQLEGPGVYYYVRETAGDVAAMMSEVSR